MFQKYFTNLFIAIIEEGSSYKLFSKVVKSGKVKEKFEKTFETKASSEELDDEMSKYLISLQEKYNYVYIALLLNSMGQGAIKGVSDLEFERSKVDPKSVKAVKFKNWSAYVSYIDINWIKKIYAKVGLDLVYSPFIVLYNLLLEHKLKTKATLYILNQENSVTVSVFKEDILYFGAFYKVNKEDVLDGIDVDGWENEEEEESAVEDLATLDTQDEEEDLSDLDDLSELDTLDTELTQGDEFSDIDEKNGIDSLLGSDVDDISIEDIELYGRDLEIYKFLNRALKEYYKNEIYESDFVEEAVIFDAYDMSHEMIDSIENDLLLDLQMHKIDIGETVCDLSVKEIYGKL